MNADVLKRMIAWDLRTGPDVLIDALVEPYYDAAEARGRSSPFRVEGYEPLADF